MEDYNCPLPHKFTSLIFWVNLTCTESAEALFVFIITDNVTFIINLSITALIIVISSFSLLKTTHYRNKKPDTTNYQKAKLCLQF